MGRERMTKKWVSHGPPAENEVYQEEGGICAGGFACSGRID